MRGDAIGRLWQLIFRVTRRRRMNRFAASFNLDSTTSVLDVGGTPGVWSLVGATPKVTLVNLQTSRSAFTQVVADGTRLPFRDDEFDVVFSNSVIEHVSDHAAFAAEIQRVGRQHFVQTPNKAFPLEPHVLTPLVNYLPKRWQRRVYRNFTVWGWIVRPDQTYVNQMVEETTLLGRSEMRALFPGARLAVGRSLISTGEFTDRSSRRVLTSASRGPKCPRRP
jgi:SAM-dependent methyltransferase